MTTDTETVNNVTRCQCDGICPCDILTREADDDVYRIGNSGGFASTPEMRPSREREWDVQRDSQAEQHTHGREKWSINATTFHAKQADDVKKFDRLHGYNCGEDVHDKCGRKFRVNRRKKDNIRWAQAIVQQVGLIPRQQDMVVDIIANTDNMNRFNYVYTFLAEGVREEIASSDDLQYPTVECVVVAVIAIVTSEWTGDYHHPAVEESAEIVGVDDVEGLIEFVAERLDYKNLC